MRHWAVYAANALGLVAMVGVFAMGADMRASELVKDPSGELRALESAAATEQSPEAVAALANAYIAQEQPGMAVAAIQRTSGETRRDPLIAMAEAKASFALGHADESRALIEGLIERCERAPCKAWVVAKARGQLDFLNELQRMGVDDPFAQPAATVAAMQRTTREVHLAMR